MKSNSSFLKGLTVAVLSLSLTGCIRLSAGYWKQGPEDEEPKGKTVALDTQELVNPNRSKGNIEIQ